MKASGSQGLAKTSVRFFYTSRFASRRLKVQNDGYTYPKKRRQVLSPLIVPVHLPKTWPSPQVSDKKLQPVEDRKLLLRGPNPRSRPRRRLLQNRQSRSRLCHRHESGRSWRVRRGPTTAVAAAACMWHRLGKIALASNRKLIREV